jgi:hypothetical protein
LPLGYFSGVALESKSKKINIAIFVVCTFAVAIAYRAHLHGAWNLNWSLFKQNFVIWILFTVISILTLLLYINSENSKSKINLYASTFLIFLTFTYAQYPVTAYANNYYSNYAFDSLSQKYFGKKNYLSLIGFSFDYSKSYDLIKNRYSNIPSQFFLKNNSDIFFDKTAWSSYSSNFIKSKESDIHQVFVLMGDPATHLLVQRLYNKLNDHIKFIVGITSEVDYQKTNQEEISIEHLKIGANPNLKAFISKSTDSRGLIKFYQNLLSKITLILDF